MDWKEEFWKLLLSNENGNYDAAYSLKSKNIPRNLYRYRDVSTGVNLVRTLNEIKTGEIYLAHPDTFNDPFDCASALNSKKASNYLNKKDYKVMFAGHILPEDSEKIFSSDNWFEMLAKHLAIEHPQITYEKLNDLAITSLQRSNKDFSNIIRAVIRVACLSESNCNLPMWYHYTNNFSGVCIEYDTSNISETLNKALFPVSYENQLIDVIKMIEDELLPKNISLFMFTASHKLSDWSYEKEWRIIAPLYLLDLDKNNLLTSQVGKNYFFSKPTKVILGCKMQPDTEKDILCCCKENNIECVKSEITEFGLKVD